jgi:hypothetical protein
MPTFVPPAVWPAESAFDEVVVAPPLDGVF